MRTFTNLVLTLVCAGTLIRAAMSQTPQLVAQTRYPAGITDLVFSRDGKTLAGAGGTVKLWDVASGNELRTFKGLTAKSQSVAFSPDGSVIATGSIGDGIVLWEAGTGRELQRLSEGWVLNVAFSRDGTTLASQDGEKIELWNLSTGQKTKHIDAAAKWALLAFTPDGNALIDAQKDGIKVRDPATGEVLRTFVGSGEKISSLSFTLDGKMLATATEENTVQLWNVAAGTEIRTISGFAEKAQEVVLRPDGKMIAVIQGKSVKVRDTLTGKEIHTFDNEGQELYSIAFSPDGQTLAIGGVRTIKLWNVVNGRELRSLAGYSESPTTICVSPDGKFLAMGTESGTIRLIGLAGKGVRGLKGHTAHILSLAFNSDSTILASGSVDKTVKLWNVATGQEIRTLTGHSERVFGVAFSSNGILASGSYDSVVKLWDVSTGAEIKTLEDTSAGIGGINCVAFSPDGKILASVTHGDLLNHAITLWDVATGSVIRKLPGHTGDITSLSFSPNGLVLVSRGQYDSEIRFWNAETGEQFPPIKGYGGSVRDVPFASDGKTMANGGYAEVVVWDMSAGRVRVKIQVDQPTSISFTPRGESLAVATLADITLFSANDGSEKVHIFTFTDDTWAAVDPSGRYDGSAGGHVPGLHWVVNNEAIELDQLKERYYEPGLVAKILGFNKEPLDDVTAFNNVALYPEASISALAGDILAFKIHLADRGGGFGRVEVRLNGKEVSPDARTGARSPDAREFDLPLDISKSPFLKAGQENTVVVRAYNREGYLASRDVKATFKAPGEAPLEHPSFWGIVAGISDYAGSDVRLQYAGKDAVDMAKALRIGADRLFGADSTHITLLTTAQEPGAMLPTRDNLRKAFETAQQAKSTDILVVYLAGHGVNYGGQGSEDADYYYLTQEARSGDLTDTEVRRHTSVSSKELTEWIKKIPATKQPLVLDTCGAGRLVQSLSERRDISSSQIRSLERMKDRTGLFILAGSAADAVSYEASQYAQGLLTYSLLLGMRGGALREERFVDVSKWFEFAADEVPRLAKDIGGIQRPIPAVPGGGASFDLGEMLSEDKSLIPVAIVRPVFLRSSFQDERQLRDGLKFSAIVNEELREAASRKQEAALVFLDTSDFPEAYSLSGLYRLEEDKVVVRVVLFKNEKQIGNFILNGQTSGLDKLAREIVSRVSSLTIGLR